MEKKELIALLEQKEKMKEQTEMIFHQLIGQISLLKDLIKNTKEDTEIKEE